MRRGLAATIVAAWCIAMAAAAADPPAVMPLGDSITYGRGNGTDIAGGYRSPLFTAVFNLGDYLDLIGSATGNPSTTLTTAGETHHNGYRSATLAELDGNLAGSVQIAGGVTNNEGGYWITGTGAGRAPAFPNAVLLLGGVNDVAGSSNVDVPTALARLDSLLGSLFTLRPDTAVFVSNLTPVTGTPAANFGTKVTAFNAGVPDIVASYANQGRKAYFVDLNAALTAADITADGIHPNQAGYDKIATTWLTSLTAEGVVVANARPTFTGTSNAAWSGAANWSGGAVPAAPAQVRFDQVRSTNLDVSGTVASLTFTAGASIAGSTSTLNSSATLTITDGLTHTANVNSSIMRVKTLRLGGDQEWSLNGLSGTNSPSSAGFTLAAPSSATSLNELDLAGFELRKTGPGQVSIGSTAIGAGNIVIEEGSIRFATANMGTGATVGMQITGTGAVTVKGGAAVMFSAASSAPSGGTTFNVTKQIRMDGTAENPALLHYAGTQNGVAPVIASPIEWVGAGNLVSFWSTNTGATGTTPWTFSGNWTGSGTATLVTSATAAQSNGRITVLSGSNGGFSGLVDNRQSDGLSTIRFGSAHAGSANAEWRLSGTSASFRLNGNSVALGALSGTTGTLVNGGATAATATIGGKGIDSAFAGLVADGAAGVLAVVKTGDGTLTLSGDNTYGGTTAVEAGGLVVDGDHTGVGLVSVASGARIGGVGSLAGNLAIEAGGRFIFNPLGPLDVAGTVTLDDTFGVSSLVNADGTAIDWSAIGNDTYTLIGLTGSTFGNIQNLGPAKPFAIGGGRTAYFTAGSLNLVVVPEPGAVGLAAAALGLLFVRARSGRRW